MTEAPDKISLRIDEMHTFFADVIKDFSRPKEAREKGDGHRLPNAAAVSLSRVDMMKMEAIGRFLAIAAKHSIEFRDVIVRSKKTGRAS